MKLPEFEYVEPKTIRKACRILESEGGQALIIAGGSDILQSLKNRLQAPRALVDLSGISRLGGISFSKRKGLEIGALVSLRQLVRDPAIQAIYPMLAQAASMVGTAQLQAMGTVGGNLCQDNLCLYYNRPPMTRLSIAPCHKLGGNVCHAVSGSKECWAVYSGDLAPALLALGAQVVIANATGTQTIALSELYSGDGLKPNVLKPGQILTRIIVAPPAPDSRAVYLKLRVRQTIDYPLLGVALYLAFEKGGDVCREARLALTGVDRAPLLIEEAAQLQGKAIGAAEIAEIAQAAHRRARPLGNVSELSPKYRRDMVDVYVRKAFEHVGQIGNLPYVTHHETWS